MKWFTALLDYAKTAIHKVTTKTREAAQQEVNALQRDASVGDLEKRFTPMRLLGGFRLRRTGKYRHGKLTKHQVALRRSAGSKFWKKACEGKL